MYYILKIRISCPDFTCLPINIDTTNEIGIKIVEVVFKISLGKPF